MGESVANRNDPLRIRTHRARLIIIGFSCTQAFIYAMFYLITYKIGTTLDVAFARLDLLVVLAWIIVAFALIYLFSRRGNFLFFSPGALIAYVVLAIAGVLLCLLCDASVPLLILEGFCLAFPAAAILCAWGRIMGNEPIDRSVPEVFIAAAFGGIACFVLAVIPTVAASIIICLLPIGSMFCHYRISRLNRAVQADENTRDYMRKSSGEQNETTATVDESNNIDADFVPDEQHPFGSADTSMSDEASKLSGRILAGTCIYGLAAGLIETFAVTTVDTPFSVELFLLLFVIYCLAALQLFGTNPVASMRAVLPRTNDPRFAKDTGPLDGAYRLAVLLLMAGFLLVPVFTAFSLSEESVVLAGYLGISTVLIALFLVMGYLARRETTLSFARGFMFLFAGEAIGIIIGNLIDILPFENAASITIPVAGIAVLCGYFFLFTERDLDALSVAVEDEDRFDEACTVIAQNAGLSKREAEILPMALRGRTSERIAKEFYISKNTVDTHMRRIYTKCNVHSRQELIDLGERTERTLDRTH